MCNISVHTFITYYPINASVTYVSCIQNSFSTYVDTELYVNIHIHIYTLSFYTFTVKYINKTRKVSIDFLGYGNNCPGRNMTLYPAISRSFFSLP